MKKTSDLLGTNAQMEAALAVAERLEAATTMDARLKTVEPGDFIRLLPGRRAILTGTMDGRDVIARVYLGDGQSNLPAEWAELTRIWPHMNTGPAQVAEPICLSADHTIMVVAAAPGKPLKQVLWAQDPAERHRFFAPAANWLRRYTRMSEITAPVRTDNWLSRCRLNVMRLPPSDLATVKCEVFAQLSRLAPALQGMTWRKAICHGDYHMANVIWDGAVLRGIDTGHSARLPIYKDIARFLVHFGRRDMAPADAQYLGIDQRAIAAFVAAFDMDEAEQQLILPFMIGAEALLRNETKDTGKSRMRRAIEMYSNMRNDLQAISVP